MNKDNKDSATMLRTLTTEELQGKLAIERRDLLDLRTIASQEGYGRKQHAEKPHLFSHHRTMIARILTILQERAAKDKTLLEI
jgi:ribosomal protein L29